MSAKSCQLCGKPLSRLRVGGDGEFCSREHRNQYGLRRGMDRLQEVDKVTNLMRRRETPRQISPARLMCNTALGTRGFLQPRVYGQGAELAPFAPMFRIPEPPRLSKVAERYIAPRTTKFEGLMQARRADTRQLRITGRNSSLEFPAPKRRLTTQVPQAPMAGLRCTVPAAAATRRNFSLLRQTEIRVHAGMPPASLRQIVLPGTTALGRNLPNRKVGATPLEGNALRVSIALGFGVPGVSRRVFVTPPAMSTALVWPRTAHGVWPETKNTTARPRSLAVRMTNPETCLPPARDGQRRAQFVFPGPLRPGKQKPRTNGMPPSRTTDVSWILSDPRTGGIGIPPTSAGFAKRNGVHLCNLTLAPTATNPTPLVAFRPFLPQEPVGCPTVPFEGTTAASIITAPASGGTVVEMPAAVEAAPAVQIQLEEHFGSGWDNWQGGTKDWLVDVAGVRTGSLALFVPTMDLVDYDLEFLARIDTKSLTWVVRATDLQEYMRCTLTAIPGGELEFSRTVVRSGAGEETVIAPVRIPGKPRAAMTVRTRVSGDTFSVTVDGRDMDTWQEDRLYCGGIGFMGAHDDRARLYWVRISSSDNIGKEHQKK
ncbi:MAG TPA: hypothetical protein VGF49_12865 [Candidatus Solibacter sp.]